MDLCEWNDKLYFALIMNAFDIANWLKYTFNL